MADALHQGGVGLLGQFADHRVACLAVFARHLHLDQFVLFQHGVQLGEEGRSDAFVADLQQGFQVMGLAAQETGNVALPDEVVALANERQRARIERDWARADRLRNKIEALGWQVQDTLDGPALTPGANSR